MSPDGLPPLREIIRLHGLAAKKSLGQNFLLDLNLTGKIARAAGDLSGSTIIEIGPGPGGLTRALLFGGAARVVAVERDERCLPALEEISAHYPGRLEIVAADALKADLPGLAAGKRPVLIVANLPYNIGTELLIRWLTAETGPPGYASMTLMFQRGGAAGIVARAGGGCDAAGAHPTSAMPAPSAPRSTRASSDTCCRWESMLRQVHEVCPSVMQELPSRIVRCRD